MSPVFLNPWRDEDHAVSSLPSRKDSHVNSGSFKRHPIVRLAVVATAPVAAALLVVGCATDEAARMSESVYQWKALANGAIPPTGVKVVAPPSAVAATAPPAPAAIDSLGVPKPPELFAEESPTGSAVPSLAPSPKDAPPPPISIALDPKGGSQIAGKPLPSITLPPPGAPASPPTAVAAGGPRRDDALSPVSLDPKTVVPVPTSIPTPPAEYPIDLATALRLADSSNPTINVARSLILEALAQQLTARTLLVPSLNGGLSYHDHTGPSQRSAGTMINLTQQSLYIGAGASTVTAGTLAIPGVSIFSQLTDAWYEPLAARQRVIGSRFNVMATSNDILLDVALLHLQLLGANAEFEAQRISETQAYEIVRVTDEYSTTGEGRQADAERAKAEWNLRRADVQKAEEAVGVSAARLAMRLNLDPSVRLLPIGGPLTPLILIDLDSTQQELIKVALDRRPDLATRTAQIGEAEVRKRQEIGRPLLPSLWLGFSGGGFGGGSNLTPPTLGRFAGRTDFDVQLYWTLMNFGAGNLALIKQRDAQLGEAVAVRQRTINRARAEVSQALADSRAAYHKISIARAELVSSDKGFREDFLRSRDNLGKPIEVINSLHLLAEARIHLINALVEFDQSQFRLWVALGSPPPLVDMQRPGLRG